MKDLGRTGNIAGLLEPIRNGKKVISNEQMKKLIDSGELWQTCREQKSRKTTEDELVLPQSLLWPTRTRESIPANANISVLAKNPSRI